EMGLSPIQSNDRNFHFGTVGEERHHLITEIPPRPRGRIGIGTVHHIAWSVSCLTSLLAWRGKYGNGGLNFRDVRDSNYLKSVYTGEFGNIVFEFATDYPGFDVDEELEHLGESLQLPEQYEDRREEYERTMPKLDL